MIKLLRKIMRMKRAGFLTVINPKTGKRQSGLDAPRKAFSATGTAGTIEQPKRIVASKKKKRKQRAVVTGELPTVSKKTLLG